MNGLSTMDSEIGKDIRDREKEGMKGHEEFILFSATFMLVRPQEVVLSGRRMSVVFVMGCVWRDKTRFSQLEFRSVTNLRSSRTLDEIFLE